MSLTSALARVLDIFAGAGVRAVGNVADVNPPCVYVLPPDGRLRFDRHRSSVEWVAYLVVGNMGAAGAVAALSDLLDAIAGLTPAVEFRRDAVQLPDGADPLPAYRITWTSLETIGGTTP